MSDNHKDTSLIEKEEDTKAPDFSGNYIEKFEGGTYVKYFPGQFVEWKKKENKYYFHAKNASLEITPITHKILKFRYANDGYFNDDFSYAVDPEFNPEYPNVKIVEENNCIVIITNELKCKIHKDNIKTTIFDLEDNVLLDDEQGYHWQEEKRFGGDIVICTKKIEGDENFYGLGDKTGSLNLKNTRHHLWGTDSYGYSNDTDTLYKNIPFFMVQGQNKGYGIFMDNTFRSFFDFGHEREDVKSFWAHGGEMRYYFIYGPKHTDISQQYIQLTGSPNMPPKWALGYHQSKWSYYPDSVVKNVAHEFRKRKIPCDVIHIDIDYMDGFRCFTWDKNRFPNPNKMINELKQQGFKTVLIIDPGIKTDKNYFVYQQGIKHGYFCTRADGALFKGSVWPGKCVFPDFTNPLVRDWWAKLVAELSKDGIDGIWNDMNEPAVFEDKTFPLDIRHDYDGHPCSHRKAHNVYGSLMTKSTYLGLQYALENKRVFTITRSAYAGIQKYSSVWTGDNVSSWEHLRMANIQCQRLSTSGVSFVGSDVGGFIGSSNGEMYTRWIQMGTFHPFFRTHSSGDHGDKEPWTFEEKYTKIIKKFIELRYRLMPYIYTSFWQYATTGIPMLRSLHLVAQDDPESFYREEEFMLGDSLLIAPISEAGKTTKKVYLPEGNWYNYWTNECIKGKQELTVDAPLEIIPLFIKEGCILPHQPLMQYVDEFEYEELTLHVYASEKSITTSIYDDAGDGYEYLKEEYSVKKINMSYHNNSLVLNQTIEGKYNSCYKKYRMIFHNFMTPIDVKVNGKWIKNISVKDDNTFELILNRNFKKILITF